MRAISSASKAQRERVAGKACAACGQDRLPCQPAHLIPRSLATDNDGDPRRVIPLCPGTAGCHRKYDTGKLDLLPYLEPVYREEVAYAVELVGLVKAIERITNERWFSETTIALSARTRLMEDVA